MCKMTFILYFLVENNYLCRGPSDVQNHEGSHGRKTLLINKSVAEKQMWPYTYHHWRIFQHQLVVQLQSYIVNINKFILRMLHCGRISKQFLHFHLIDESPEILTTAPSGC